MVLNAKHKLGAMTTSYIAYFLNLVIAGENKPYLKIYNYFPAARYRVRWPVYQYILIAI